MDAAAEKVTVLPGKKYTPEEILQIVWHRKWLILVPFVVASVCTALVAQRLPKRYRSETVILVVPQRVPESYVRSTVTTRIEDRLSSLREQILSRSRLERVIQDFNLYEDLRRKAVMEDVVDGMRRAIDVKVERGDAFRVSFTSSEPRTAQKVTERLASLFIEENLRDREVQAEGTNQFLDSQLEEARRRLLEKEKKLEDYKRAYGGQLPSQVQTNLQAIQSAQLQLQALAESINRDRDRRLVLERQIADVQATPAAAPALPISSAGGTDQPAGGTTAQQLEVAQARLRGLELKFTPEHPDVKAMKSVIRDLEAKLKAESARVPAGDVQRPVVNTAEVLRQNKLRDLNAEMQNLDDQLERKHAQEQQLTAVMASYQSKIDAAPTREAELTELTRDYSTLAERLYRASCPSAKTPKSRRTSRKIRSASSSRSSTRRAFRSGRSVPMWSRSMWPARRSACSSGWRSSVCSSTGTRPSRRRRTSSSCCNFPCWPSSR